MDKRRSLAELVEERKKWRAEEKTVVWTNGCFDLFHAGHVRALETAKSFGDILIVGLNSDRSVRELKCAGRPLCGEDDRAAMLSALETVDRILVFDGQRCDRELTAIRPDVWTKSGDYTLESLDAGERGAVQSYGGRIEITPLIPGLSTTLLVKKIRRFDPEKVVSAACSFIRDRRGRILMVATRYTDGVKWSLPGGGHNHGETLPATAARETLEETGFEIEIVRHMGVVERISPDKGLHLVLHMFEAVPADMSRLDTRHFPARPEESIEGAAWFDRERFKNEPGIVLGRRLWLEYGDRPEEWPPYLSLEQGEE